MNILVTGGSSGLGKQLVNDLLSYNHTIFYTYNQNEVSFDNLNVKSFKVDFNNLIELDDFLLQIRDLQIDVLINNYFNKIDKMHAHKLDRQSILLGVLGNVIPTIEITNSILATMRKKRKGLIINVLTDYLKSSTPIGLSKYNAEKSYLEKFIS